MNTMRNAMMAVLVAMAMGTVSVRADEAAVAAPAATTYEADLMHAKLGFRVGHLVISKVNGEFKAYSATLKVEGSQLIEAEAVIEAKSIDTGIADRDAHVRNADFLDVEKFPEIRFKSTSVSGDKLVGDLTIRGVTRSVELTYAVKGPIQDPWGNTKLGFEAQGVINREDFGLTWNKALETGGFVVAKDVEITIDMEFGQKK
jgi:polyisoprenoid-binding protein YceI